MTANQYAIIGYPDSYNLGDEVQSIAAAHLLPRVDMRIPRERLDTLDPEVDHVRLLCNGFFMHRPERWPPDERIEPLFVSFHVSTETGADRHLLLPELKAYYQRYGPIGCRDRGTQQRFEAMGVDAYFSGCVTLTLQNPFPAEARNEEIILADPFYKFQNADYRKHLRHAIVPVEHRERVVELTHRLPYDRSYTEEEKIALAQTLLDRYARASLVITSRIHVALPCLAFGTPVQFINTGYDRNPHDRERFDGLIQLFHTVDASHFPLASRKPLFKLARLLRLHRLFPVKPLSIDFTNPPVNKELHLPLARAIRARVSAWLGDDAASTV